MTNNPVGVVYKATLPKQAFFKPAYPDGGNVKGEITASAGPNGAGVIFNLKFSNLPKTGGPFSTFIVPVPLEYRAPKSNKIPRAPNPTFPSLCELSLTRLSWLKCTTST